MIADKPEPDASAPHPGAAEAIAAWMLRVMDEKGWSAESWARRAGTTPTNITRFLKTREVAPTWPTLAKLARVAGSAPELLPGRAVHSASTVRVYRSLFEAVAGGPHAERILTMRDVSTKAYALRVETGALTARGVVPGDLAIVEPVEVLSPRDNDAVVLMDDDGPDFGLFIGGMVHRFDGRAAQRAEDVVLAGVVVEIQRALR